MALFCHKLFNAKYGQPLRQLIAEGKRLSEVVHFGDEQVFTGATTYTRLTSLGKAGTTECPFVKVDDLVEWRANGEAEEGKVPIVSVTSDEWNFVVGSGAGLFEQLRQMPVKLEYITDRIFQGVKTTADQISVVEEIEREDGRIRIFSREKNVEYWLEADLLHPLIKGGDSRQYWLSRIRRLILISLCTSRERFDGYNPAAKDGRRLSAYVEVSSRK